MGWKSTEEVCKILKFPTFSEAWAFVSRVAASWEDHLNFEVYRPDTKSLTPVRISLGYQGSVTSEDIALAERVEQAYTKHKNEAYHLL